MPEHTLLSEPADHVDEPRQVQDYRGLMSRIAATRRPVIVRRGGADVAAVIPVEHLELLLELLARQEAERRTAEIDCPILRLRRAVDRRQAPASDERVPAGRRYRPLAPAAAIGGA